jgi:hypothetical protein
VAATLTLLLGPSAGARALAALAITLGGCAGSPEPPERIVYLAIGASDAAGMGAEPLTQGYVFRIADELDEQVDEVFLAPLAIPDANTEQLDAAWNCFSRARSSRT